MKKTLIKIVCVAAAVLLVFGTVAACFAEEFTLTELTDTTVVAKVNDKEITWADCKEVYDELVTSYGSYYDLTQPLYEGLFRAVAVEEVAEREMMNVWAGSLGITMTDEDKAAYTAEAEQIWEENVESYISYYYTLTDESTDEEKAEARTAAENYFLENYGYTKESYTEMFVDYYMGYAGLEEKVFNLVCQDITVSDEEVAASRAATVAADQELYANDLEGYCTYVSQAEMMAYYTYMYTGTYEVVYPTYRPAGFRSVKHVLLQVDDSIMTAYTDAQAAYEEQQSTLEAGETLEEGTTVVTAEDVAAAEAAVLASVADQVEAINQRYSAGEDFDTLITEYSIDTNVEMEVCAYTTDYYQNFTDAAMAIAAKGELSAPAVTPYGVHVILYYDDIPEGPIELTDAEFEALRTELLEEKQENAYNAAYAEFKATQSVEYMIPTSEEVMALINAQSAEEATEEATEETAEEPAE